MNTGLSVSLLFWLLLALQLCSASILQNPLDIGRVHSCLIPQTSACFINYTVPESVSSLTSVKDAYINETVSSISNGVNENCLNGLRQVLCSEEYPHCDQTEATVNLLQPTNCSQLLSSCPDHISNQYCSFSLSNASLGECRTISDFVSETGYTFRRCNTIASNWLSVNYVTEWMFHYLMRTDQQVEREVSEVLTGLTIQCTSGSNPLACKCIDRYIAFRCGGIGRCWDQGNRVELLTNQSDCYYLHNNCLSNNQRNTLSKVLQCAAWPDYTQPPTIPTDITPTPLIPINSTNRSSSIIPSSSSSLLSSSIISSSLLPTVEAIPSAAAAASYVVTITSLLVSVFGVIFVFLCV